MRWHKKLRVLRCYLFILGWLGFLLLCFSYWKIDTDSSHSPGPLPRRSSQSSSSSLSEDKPRHRRPRAHCNAPDHIKLGYEGEIPSDYELSGLIIVLRHGDRGPLMAVRNFSSINCGYKSYGTPMYKHFVTDILNASKTNTYINFVGPFMKFPILPPPSRCTIGHLTPLGIAQHLQLGKILRSLYIDKLKLITYPWELDDVEVYSTKYRRTFQSILAFLHSFLPIFDLTNIRMKEAKGVTLCENYCRCDRSLLYDHQHETEKNNYLKSHPSIVDLIAELSPLVKPGDLDEEITNPYVMRDALLAYACHGAKFPCENGRCITFDDLAKILSYEEWEAKQRRTPSQVKSAKLKSYGFLSRILSIIDAMMSASKPRVAIFSGHDKSLNHLLTSFGIPHFQAPNYGARIIIELYHNTSAPSMGSAYRKNYHFRIVYNGKDITKLIPFCSFKIVRKIDSGNARLSNMALCPVDSVKNYLKPNLYFKDFNATSFTAACIK